MDNVKLEADLQGLAYDESDWQKVAEQMVRIGLAMDKLVIGINDPGRLFLDTAVSIDVLMHIIRHMNEHQEFLPPHKVVCDCPDPTS